MWIPPSELALPYPRKLVNLGFYYSGKFSLLPAIEIAKHYSIRELEKALMEMSYTNTENSTAYASDKRISDVRISKSS